MSEKNKTAGTPRDRIMRAWENSMELTRDFRLYADTTDDKEMQQVFKAFAEDEGKHAAKFKEMLEQIDK